MFKKVGRPAILLMLLMVLTCCTYIVASSQQVQQDRASVTPTYEVLNPTTPIFFIIRDEFVIRDEIVLHDEPVEYNRFEGIVQVWKITVDGVGGWAMVELPIPYPVSALPSQELAILEHKFCPSRQDHCFVDDIHLAYGLNNLRLSPNKQSLAWVDGALWCPSTSCYGFQRLVLWNVTRGESQTLLEIPNHIDLRTAQGIGGISWSPDSNHLGFVQSSNDRGWSRVRVIDTETGHINDIGDGRAPIVWGPDGRIAFISYSWQDVIVALNNGDIIAEFSNNWDLIEGIDWSSDGSKIAVTAVTDDHQTRRYNLFIIDWATGDIAKIDVLTDESLEYTQPHWSPDGRLLGINTRRSEEETVSGLIVFDPKSGAVEANLAVERYSTEWSWSHTGDAILVQLGANRPVLSPSTSQRIGIFYWTTGTLDQVPLRPDLATGLDEGRLYMKEPVW